MSRYAEIKAKVDSGEYTIFQKRSRSKVYEVFYQIKNSNGKIFKNAVFCKLCRNVYTHTFGHTSNLTKHRCFKNYKDETETPCAVKVEPSEELKDECAELITNWVIGSARHYEIVNSTGFRKFIECLLNIGSQNGPNVDVNSILPEMSEIRININSMYKTERKELQEDLLGIKCIGFSITCYEWQEDWHGVQRYVVITGHYIKSGTIAHKYIGMCDMSSDENVRDIAASILEDRTECKINQLVTIVGNDNSDSSVKCMNTLLNTAVEKAISDVTILNSVINTCSLIVDYLEESDIEVDLKEDRLEIRLQPKFLNSLKICQENWNVITTLPQNKNMSREVAEINFASIHLADINNILEVLKPFEETSAIICSKTFPTLHHVIPQIHYLKALLSKNNANDSEEIKDFKNKILLNIESIVNPNIKDLHKIALFLFPPTNKLKTFSRMEKKNIYDKCKDIMSAYSCYQPHTEIIIKCENEEDMCTDAFTDFINTPVSNIMQDEIESEIFRYEQQTVLYYNQFNPIEWWAAHQEEYPMMYKLSCFVFSTPASWAIGEEAGIKASPLILENGREMDFFDIDSILGLHLNSRLNSAHADQELYQSANCDSESS